MDIRRLALIPIMASILGSVPSHAYQVFGYWPPASYIYDYHTMSTSWQSTVASGSSQWNFSGSLFEWSPGTTGSNDITLTALDGSSGPLLGLTTANLTDSNGQVIANGQLTWINIRFDSGESWYTGSGTPTSTQYDVRSVAAHEFGHALGLLHTQSANCTGSTTTRPTMCGTAYPPGVTWMRSLQQDDRDGALFLYSSLRARDQETIKVKGNKRIMVHFEYREMSLAEAVSKAEHAVHGVVTEVTETRWNQDSGEYWEDFSEDGTTLIPALPYFMVRLSEVSELGSGRRPLGREVVITVPGISPLDNGGEVSFEVGDELIALIRPTLLTWRDGRRRILQFVRKPIGSYFLKAGDGQFYLSDPVLKGQGLILEEVSDLMKNQRSATAQ